MIKHLSSLGNSPYYSLHTKNNITMNALNHIDTKFSHWMLANWNISSKQSGFYFLLFLSMVMTLADVGWKQRENINTQTEDWAEVYGTMLWLIGPWETWQ